MVDSIEFGMDSSYLALHCGARGSSEPAFPSSSVLSLDALRIDQQITIRHVDRLLHGPQQGRPERGRQGLQVGRSELDGRVGNRTDAVRAALEGGARE